MRLINADSLIIAIHEEWGGSTTANEFERLVEEQITEEEVAVPDINDLDTISRQQAIEALNKLDVSDGVGISSIACSVQESAISVIQDLPPAQLKQKKRKLNQKRDLVEVKCSECGQSGYFELFRGLRYCPWCGFELNREGSDNEK